MKTLLKNGTIYDGSGEKPYVADLLIEGNRIAGIGQNLDEEGCDKVIDVTGCTVAPGFIDSHSHNDFFATRPDHSTAMAPFLRQGITTQITGNCGFSVCGVDPDTKYRDKVGGGLFKAYEACSLKEWVQRNTGKLDLNIVPLDGHGSNRISVSGYKASKLTDEEMKRMLDLLEQDLKDGSWGGSFGLMYEPGMYSDTEELTKYAEVLKKYDAFLTVHPRACSDVSNGFSLLKRHHLELGLKEVTDIMEKTGVKLEYSHLIFTGRK